MLRHGARRRGCGLLAAALGTGMPLVAMAANGTWTFAGSGNWTTASNWLGGVPTDGAAAIISHNDAINRTITYDYAGPSIDFATFQVQNIGTGTTLFVQNANTFTTSFEVIGDNAGGAGFWRLTG